MSRLSGPPGALRVIALKPGRLLRRIATIGKFAMPGRVHTEAVPDQLRQNSYRKPIRTKRGA